MQQWKRNNSLYTPAASPTRTGLTRTFKTSQTRVRRRRRSAKQEAERPHNQILTTKTGQIRKSQRGLFIHFCDICKKGPYSRREHLNRHKKHHGEPTREGSVHTRNFKKDAFLQQHRKKTHANPLKLPRAKSEPDSADESKGVLKISPLTSGTLSPLTLETTSRSISQRSEASEPADVKWPSYSEQLLYTTVSSALDYLSCATINETFSHTESHDAQPVSSAKSDSTIDDSVPFIPYTSPGNGAIKQTQSWTSQLKGPPSNQVFHTNNAFRWPLQCPDMSTAALRGLVRNFSSVYGKEWMGDLFNMPSRHRQNGIDQSLFAVTAMWQTKSKKQSPLRQRAIYTYQGAILNVRAQLNNYRISNPFVLVATSMIFAATEAQVDDGADQSGWITHIKGALAVLSSTKPQIWGREEGIRLYIDLRYMALLLFLGSRKPFFMAGKEWKSLNWPGSSKTTRESLIDELVDLPGLLCDCSALERKLKKLSTAVCAAELSQVRHLLDAFKNFEMRLNSWRLGVEEQYPGCILYWKQSCPDPMPLSSTDEVLGAIFFANPLIAESLTLYWAALLLIYLSTLDIYTLIQPRTSNIAIEFDPATHPAFSDDFVQAYRIWQPAESSARKLANLLGQSLDYVTGDSFQPLNGARLACHLFWPAIRFFVRFKGSELGWLQGRAQSMSENTGLQYVSKIATNPVDIFMKNAERE